MNNLFKLSIAVTVLSILVIAQTYVLSTEDYTRRFKIYRMEVAILISFCLIPSSKFLWKRLVYNPGSYSDRTLNEETISLSVFVTDIIRKLFVAGFLASVHCFPLTLLHIFEEPPLLNIWSWTCFGFYFMFLCILLFIRNVTQHCTYVFNRTYWNPSRQTRAAFLITIAFVWIAFVIANRPPKIVRVDIRIAKLPPSLHGLRIALLSDVHLGPTVGYSKLNQIVKLTNNLYPDIIVIAGDLTDIAVADSDGIAKPLETLEAPMGKFFVTGNHEYHTGDVDNWFLLLESFGFTILHNDNKKISGNNKKEWLCLIGVDDWESSIYGYKDHGMDLSRAYRGCDKCHISVLVAHQPKAANFALTSNYTIDLILTGHTHGGQFFPVSIPIYLFNPFFHGLYRYKRSYIYVTQGTGYFGLPLRFLSYPEITEIALKSY